MIYWELFTGFLYAGCFTFGGAYAAIPLIRDVVLSHGWLTDQALTDMIAVSESTPGPIMINLATYVGSSQGGILGSLLATFAVSLPAFVIILAASAVLDQVLKNRYASAAFAGLTACIAGVIPATGIFLALKGCMDFTGGYRFSGRGVLIGAALIGIRAVWPKIFRKKLSPITMILIAAVLGAIIYSI